MFGLANNTMTQIPIESIARLCDYFGADIHQLLTLVEDNANIEALTNPELV